MWLKTLNIASQITIIFLALVIVFTMSKKQMIDSTFSSFQKRVDEQLAEDRKHYDEKIGMVQDNLNRYQLNREQRAQFITARIDEMYTAYKKNSEVLVHPPTSATIVAEAIAPQETIIDKNLSFIEGRINKVSEQVDVNNNKLESRVSILEQRINTVSTQAKAGSVKVIQNNLNQQTVNNK